MPKNNKGLSKDEQKIIDLYVREEWSTYKLAEKFKTYPNKIRRILNKGGVPLRDKSTAQKNAIKKGRSTHPTEGKQRSSATKLKISETQGHIWDNLDKKQRVYRSEIGKKAWEKKSEDEKASIIKRAQDSVREASKKGSKLERFLLKELTERNFGVEFHKERWLRNQRLQVDLFIPGHRTAIEVDGPSHFKPVWGHKNLEKNRRADREKTGLILSEGLVLIRIKQEKRLSQRYMRDILSRLLKQLAEIKEFYPKENERYFEI